MREPDQEQQPELEMEQAFVQLMHRKQAGEAMYALDCTTKEYVSYVVTRPVGFVFIVVVL